MSIDENLVFSKPTNNFFVTITFKNGNYDSELKKKRAQLNFFSSAKFNR